MFFYGTLCDLRLCEIVLGRSRDQMQFSDALLHDHAVYWARGQNFPVIVREKDRLPGPVADGVGSNRTLISWIITKADLIMPLFL